MTNNFCTAIALTLQRQYYRLCKVSYVLRKTQYIALLKKPPEKRIFAHEQNGRRKYAILGKHIVIFFIDLGAYEAK